MISVIAQERLLGAALGCVCSGLLVFRERKNIYGSIADICPHSEPRLEPRKNVIGKSSGPDFSHVWNKAVDNTFGPLIASLSSRGW